MDDQRKLAAHKLEAYKDEFELNDRNLRRLSLPLKWSRVSQAVAVEATLGAVSGGAAGWLARGVTAKLALRATQAVQYQGVRVVGVARTGGFRVVGVAGGATGSSTRIDALSNVVVNVAMTAARRSTGDFAANPDAYKGDSWKGIAVQFILAALSGAAGRAGGSVDLTKHGLPRRLANFGLKDSGRVLQGAGGRVASPGAVSGGANSAAAALSELNAYLRSDDAKRLMGCLRRENVDARVELDTLASASAESLVEYAAAEERAIDQRVQKAAKTTDFSKLLGAAAKLNVRGHEQALRSMMPARDAAAQKLELWNAVYAALVAIERARRELKVRLSLVTPIAPEKQRRKPLGKATRHAVTRRDGGESLGDLYARPPAADDAVGQAVYGSLKEKYGGQKLQREWNRWANQRGDWDRNGVRAGAAATR